MAKKQSKAKRNTKPPPTAPQGNRPWDWSHVTTLVPILLADGSFLPAKLGCKATGGPPGQLELTPDNDRWPIVDDISPTAVIPDRVKAKAPA